MLPPITAEAFGIIKKDFILQEGKIFYNILQTTRIDRKKILTPEQIMFGKTNLESPTKDFENYLNFKIDRLTAILQKTTDTTIKEQLQAYVDCKDKIFNKNK